MCYYGKDSVAAVSFLYYNILERIAQNKQDNKGFSEIAFYIRKDISESVFCQKRKKEYYMNTIIAVDAMGGDNAPGAIVKGAVEAANEQKDIIIHFFVF